ncbi:GNAT family N-acetyltransferase [Paludibacter sp. 221]|uniref:GNAT family N-acetyltransferase n=1 Tax=Paludibacter sp. 221 TaxID=2302939 RepID=UPI0013D75C20|nr:GNAT family N-acetyltransferase [Paludibacter sp. 221]NDV47363.1 GNAT family N-acetyltransferase [Paludibacter sp. 221]
MIDFQQITSSSDPLFDKMYHLYTHAFPAAERRSLGALESILNYEKRFEADVLMIDGYFVGFFTYWKFERFIYVEHFAVDPSLRGQNIGTEAMNAFLLKANLPVVLEVEMPEDPQSIRRISFYERLGFKVLQHSYAQPYYDGSGNLLPMLIMSNDPRFADRHFSLIKSTLYTEVYKHFPEEK